MTRTVHMSIWCVVQWHNASAVCLNADLQHFILATGSIFDTFDEDDKNKNPISTTAIKEIIGVLKSPTWTNISPKLMKCLRNEKCANVDEHHLSTTVVQYCTIFKISLEIVPRRKSQRFLSQFSLDFANNKSPNVIKITKTLIKENTTDFLMLQHRSQINRWKPLCLTMVYSYSWSNALFSGAYL